MGLIFTRPLLGGGAQKWHDNFYFYLLVNENLLRLLVLDVVEVIRVFTLALTRNYFPVKTVMPYPLCTMISRYQPTNPLKKKRGKTKGFCCLSWALQSHREIMKIISSLFLSSWYSDAVIFPASEAGYNLPFSHHSWGPFCKLLTVS